MRLETTKSLKLLRSGFTLIELLIVIAIIGLLAALIFPVFSKVRGKARQVTCISNMRQLGQTFMIYAQDYDEVLPEQWKGRTLDINRSAISSAWETYLRPYTKNVEINHCPSDRLSTPLPVPDTDVVLFSSYAVPWNIQGKSLERVPATANTVLLVENWQGETLSGETWLVQQLGKRSFNPEDGVFYEQPDFRHTEMGNYLFMDTHLKSLRGPNPIFEGYKLNATGSSACGSEDPLPQ